MKTGTLTIVLALTAAPAFAVEFPIFLGHRDPEYRGIVYQWPEVARARERERLCVAQQLAIYEREKWALEAATPALYGPAFGLSGRAVTTTTAQPTPAPPPPTVPSNTRPATPPVPTTSPR
jgi:hypothetical protein